MDTLGRAPNALHTQYVPLHSPTYVRPNVADYEACRKLKVPNGPLGVPAGRVGSGAGRVPVAGQKFESLYPYPRVLDPTGHGSTRGLVYKNMLKSTFYYSRQEISTSFLP